MSRFFVPIELCMCYIGTMRKQVWCWVCELCGHTWIATGIDAPGQCSKCKRRGWHTKQADVPQAVERPIPAGHKPTMDALRSICAGNVPMAVSVDDSPERVPCKYTEYDTETGETYGCRLAAHSGKIKHQRGPAL